MYRRIRDLREDSDLLQRDLAEYLQVRRSAIPTTRWASATFQQTF